MSEGTGLLKNYDYDPDQYQWEKIIGKRRPTGALKLKRLKGFHRTVIGLHLRALSNRDIASVTGLDEISVSRILNDPLSQEYISAHFQGVQAETRALLVEANDVVRNALYSNSERVRLEAADKVFKMNGAYKESAGKSDETSEDVIARAMEIMHQQSGTINNLVQDRRLQNIIDVTPPKDHSMEVLQGANERSEDS